MEKELELSFSDKEIIPLTILGLLQKTAVIAHGKVLKINMRSSASLKFPQSCSLRIAISCFSYLTIHGNF